MNKLKHLLVALGLILSPVATFAGNHGVDETEDEYAEHEKQHQQEDAAKPFEPVEGLATHGTNMMWVASIPDVLTAASNYPSERVKAYMEGINAMRACLDKQPTAAFEDTENPGHYECVHPVTDMTANLAALLTSLAPNDATVTDMNRRIDIARDIYAKDAICGYVDYLANKRQKELEHPPELPENPFGGHPSVTISAMLMLGLLAFATSSLLRRRKIG